MTFTLGVGGQDLDIQSRFRKIRVLCYFFVLFTALICSDLIFNFLKRVTDGTSLFLCKTLVFLPFLNLRAQISCPQNLYSNLK